MNKEQEKASHYAEQIVRITHEALPDQHVVVLLIGDHGTALTSSIPDAELREVFRELAKDLGEKVP